MTPDVHALTGPYVLNALPEDERIEFEAHLADCAACSAEVAELREASTKLGTAVGTPPPPALKARVLAEVATTRQLPPVLRSAEPLKVKKSRMSRRSFFSLAAAGLAVAGAGGIAIDQYRENQRTERQNEELAALLAQPDAKTARDAVEGGGRATIVMSPSQDRAIVLLHGLRALPDGKTYQLWLMDRSNTPHSVGLAGPETTTVIQGGLANKVALGITVENAPGATSPTFPPAALIAMA
ncbi:anti-sigma-K factor RskA [Kribbella amoyensis]|uniref:Regulator of SigK n=1 Tax=Kribbella amoyensis TaxID=996641 RepID=A0A561BY49_9ACTN|nr:anti-sigma factor [Kribbella amoyensis]TWD83809.1 anti-sigma-K factor RskA [Kribbella amoyensis]